MIEGVICKRREFSDHMSITHPQPTESIEPWEHATTSGLQQQAKPHTAQTRWTVPRLFLGRDTTLQQLINTLTTPLTPEHSDLRHVLITAEAGMGKTTLLQHLPPALRQVGHHHVLSIDIHPYKTTSECLTALYQDIFKHASTVLDHALEQANTLNEQIGVTWTRDDLLRAIGLIKLQEEVDQVTEPDTFIPRQRIANAIKSAMPMIKRFHFSSVNHCIKQLVLQLQDPWLYVASQLIYPTHPQLQSITETLNHFENNHHLKDTGTDNNEPHTEPTSQPAESTLDPSESEDLDQVLPTSESTLIHQQLDTLHALLSWIHHTLPPSEHRFIIALDSLETITTWPTLEKTTLQQSVYHLLSQSSLSQTHWVLTCRSEALSQALSPKLIEQCRVPIILPRLTPRFHQQLIHGLFDKLPIEITTEASQELMELSQGNPYWSELLIQYIGDRLLANKQTNLTAKWIAALGLTSAHDVLETALTQIKLSHIPYEADALRVIASMLRTHRHHAFNLQKTVETLHHEQNLPTGRIQTVLQQLQEYGFLTQVTGSTPQQTGLQIASRITYDFLKAQCQWIDTEMTVDSQIKYLKKIIPLSIQSGELDREKTQEVIALSTSSGQQELITFLEETFTEHLSHPTASVRITALNNLAMLHTKKALSGILSKLSDHDSSVQEYAIRNITYISQKNIPAPWLATMAHQLIQHLDDNPSSVRILAYETLSQLAIPQNSPQMTAVYLKALSDHEEAIRFVAIQHIQSADQQSAWVRHATLEAMHDTSDRIRHQACLNLRHNPHPKVTEALIETLEHDANPTIRSLAAKMIAEHATTEHQQILKDALHQDLDEDVQVSIIRAFQHFNPTESEPFIANLLHQRLSEGAPPNTIIWACIQTLARVGSSAQTLQLLTNIQNTTQSPIILNATEAALIAINTQVKAQQQAHQHANNPIIYTSM